MEGEVIVVGVTVELDEQLWVGDVFGEVVAAGDENVLRDRLVDWLDGIKETQAVATQLRGDFGAPALIEGGEPDDRVKVVLRIGRLA